MKIRTNMSRIEFDSPVLGRSWIPVRACELTASPIDRGGNFSKGFRDHVRDNFSVRGSFRIRERFAKFILAAKCPAKLISVIDGCKTEIRLLENDVDSFFRYSMPRQTRYLPRLVTRKITRQFMRVNGAVFDFVPSKSEVTTTWATA